MNILAGRGDRAINKYIKIMYTECFNKIVYKDEKQYRGGND